MKPATHAAISLSLAAVLYMIFQSWMLSLGCLMGGIVIDIDYAVDYCYHYGFRFKKEDAARAYRENLLPWVRIFHGWEWLLPLLFIAWITGWNHWVAGMAAGFIVHLFLDTINARERFCSYSLLWRWRRGFRHNRIFKGVRRS